MAVDPIADAAGGSTTTSTESGVPTGSVTMEGYIGGPYQVSYQQDWIYGGAKAPMYHNGDQFLPYDWSVERITQLQATLIDAGFLDPKNVDNGVWDPTTATAYAKALAWANANGVTFEEAMGKLRGNGGRSGSGSGSGLGAKPMTIEDITELANRAAQGVLGRKLRSDELAAFIPAFQASVAGGTTPTTAALNQAQAVNPAEASGHSIGGMMAMLSQMLQNPNAVQGASNG